MGSPATAYGQKRIAFADIGNWSSKEGLPQRIVEGKNGCLMFQSESNNSWYYEISDAAEGGPVIHKEYMTSRETVRVRKIPAAT